MNDIDDARAMAALAAGKGVRTIVGLQSRQSPAIEFAQGLLTDGYVDEVLSTTMVGLSVPGDVVVQANAYMLDRTNGANALTIAVGHSLDILNYVPGEFAELSAVSQLRRPLITIQETGEQIAKTAGDQIAVIGTLTSGATASVHVREAVASGMGFLWEINGTGGTLRLTADAAVPGIFPLTVAGAHGRGELAELAVSAELTRKWPALTSLGLAPPTQRTDRNSVSRPYRITPSRVQRSQAAPASTLHSGTSMDFELPKLADNLVEGTVSRWLKKPNILTASPIPLDHVLPSYKTGTGDQNFPMSGDDIN
jgi:hypothetical protein